MTSPAIARFVALLSAITACGGTATPAGDAADIDAETETAQTETADAEADAASGQDGPMTFVALDLAAMPARWDGTTAGRTWHVAPHGTPGGDGSSSAPFDHVATALARAASGDVVLLGAGEYAEWDDDSGHAFSIRTERVVVAGAPGEVVTIVPGAGSFGYGPQLAASGAVLANVTVRGFDAVGVELGGAGAVSSLVVQDVVVDVPSEGIVSYEGLAGGAPVIRGLLLDRVTIRGAGLIGLSCNVGPCVGVHLSEVTVRMDPPDDDAGSGADAIAFEDGDNLWLDRVEVEGAGADGIDLKADRVLITRTFVHHVRRNGLKLWRGGDVQNTIVSHTGADASLVLDGPGRYRLLNSVVAHHLEGRSGAYTMTVAYDHPTSVALELEITNCIFVRGSGPISVPSLAGVRIRHSVFGAFAEGGDVVELRDSGERLDPAGLVAAGIGEALTSGEPDVIDTETFRPRPGGALVDAGVISAPMPPTDRDGQPRVVGRAPDIGAYELPEH